MIDPMDANQDRAPLPAPLSAGGAARRDSMLPGLLQAMAKHHARRRSRRRAMLGAGAATAIVLLAWGLSIVLSSAPRDGRVDRDAAPRIADRASPADSDLKDAWSSRPVIYAVSTDPMVLERFRPPVGSRTATVQRLDDDALLTLLDEIGRPAGLIRMSGQTRLTHAVADNEPGLMPEGLNLF